MMEKTFRFVIVAGLVPMGVAALAWVLSCTLVYGAMHETYEALGKRK